MRSLNLLLLGGLLLGAVGCSSFHREWKTARKSEAPATGLVGPWEGIWKSSVNGHEGRLRCLVHPAEAGVHPARFRAEYWGILRLGYSLPLRVEPSPDTVRFHGQADLGWLYGGVYACEGEADGRAFKATYTSRHDHGIFEMHRPSQVVR